MGLGPFDFSDSSSKAEDNRMLASDRGQTTRGTQNLVAQDSARVVGAKGKYQAKGAIDLAKGAKLNTGLDITGGVKGNITINDTAPLSNLATQFSDTVKTITSGNQQTVRAIDPATGTNNTVLYVVLGVMALLAWVFYRK